MNLPFMFSAFSLLIKDILVGRFSTNMLHLYAPPPLYDFVGLGLELHHGRKISRNGVGGPNFGVDNTVKRPAKFLDGPQAGQ